MHRKWTRLILSGLLVAVLIMGLSVSTFASGDSNQGKTPLEKARKVLEEKLVGLPGIAGIAHVEETGEIIVLLENERPKGQVPSRFEGFLVRTEISGKFYAHTAGVVEPVAPTQVNAVSSDRLNEVSPLVGGVSVSALAGEIYIYAGTLGMVTYDNKILSNAHVIAMNPDNNSFLSPGTVIVQPGTLDGGFTADNQVGELEQYIEIKFDGTTNYADAAIAAVDNDLLVSPGWQFGTDSEYGDYQISGTTMVVRGDTVRKSGRTSGVTERKVYLSNASVTVDYGYGKEAYFEDQIIVRQPFSQGGDSGSAVDKDGKFVGLVFAGSNLFSIVCKASHIIDGLDIAYEPTTSPEPPALKSITVSPPDASIEVGNSQQFTAIGKYSDGSSKDLTVDVAWASSVPTVATVDASGLATGITDGVTTINAGLEGVNGTTTLTVTQAQEPPPTGDIVVNITNMTTDSRNAGKNTFVWAIAPVSVMLDGSGLGGATVEGHWDGATTGNVSGITDAHGDISFQSSSVKSPSTGTTFTFVVDRVIDGSNIYEIGISNSTSW